MLGQEAQNFWKVLKRVLEKTPESKKFKSQAFDSIRELKSKTSQFEKDLIKNDLSKIKTEIRRVFRPSKVN